MEGIKRIEKMLEGQKDKYLQIIGKYLIEQTELDSLYLNKEKNLKGMAEYIKGKARKQATGNVAIIEDAVVFDWAKEYFVKSNEELGIKKNEVKKTDTHKEENIEAKDEFGSIFDITEKDTNTTSNEKEEIEQISFF